MNKIELKKSQMIIAGVLAFFILCLILGTLHSYQSMHQALNQLAGQKQHLEQLSDDIEQTRKSIDKMKKEQDEFKGLLFDERDVPTFLESISGSAAKSSVHVLEIKTQQFSQVIIPKELTESTSRLSQMRNVENLNQANPQQLKVQQLTQMLTLAAMPIRIKVHGTFNSIVSFLNSIEGYRQLLTISNVEIATQRDYPQLNCEFTLRIYSLKTLGDIKL